MAIRQVGASKKEFAGTAAGSFGRLWREPLAHFLLLGFALFLLYWAVGNDQSPPGTAAIRVDGTELESMSAAWAARTGRRPNLAEMSHLVDAHLRREVLYREALALGLHLDDAATRTRLASQLEDQWRYAARAVAPDETQLRAFFESNRSFYREPMQLTFTHRFFATVNRGADARSEADAALADLQAGREINDDAHEGASTLTLRSVERVIARFGPAFSQRVLGETEQGSLGRWFGPIASPLGWHVVRVDGFHRAGPVTFEEARSRILSDWRDDFESRDLERRVSALRKRYTTEVDSIDTFVDETSD